MTPTTISLRTLLDGVRRTLRRDTRVTVALSALCAIPAALLFAWLLALLRPWSRPGFGPLLLDGLVFIAAATLIFFGMRRWLDVLNERTVAADAERTAGIPEGTVLGALELSRSLPDGTSRSLARRAELDVGRRFAGVAPRDVALTLRERVRRRRRAAAGAFATLSTATLLLAFAAPEHSRAAWSPMARPVSHLVPPPLPALSVLPGDTEVHRGSDLPVHVRAPGREAVTLHWRMQGDVPHEHTGPVTGDSAVFTIADVDADTEYWVAAPDGAVSRRFRITPADPLLLAELAVDVVYPPHIDRATDHYQGDVPLLEVPEGTQLVIRGRATRSLADAGLGGDADGARFTIQDDRFTGSFSPTASGLYAWLLRDDAGGEAAIAPAPIEIVVLPDASPHVEIRFPAADTVLDASQRQAIVADARDDFGLRHAHLVSWRVGGSGERGDDVEQPIELTGDDRALIRAVLDASSRTLIAGDTLKFFIRVTDNSPRRQTAVSRTVSLRLPGIWELREQSAERADDMVADAAQLAKTADALQQETRDIERRASAANARRQAEQSGNRTGENSAQRMDYQEASASRQMLDRQEDMVAQMEAMRENLEAFERAMERAGLRDGELAERLEEMRQLYDEMLTPEMRAQMEQLRRALEQLDPEALQEALEQMAEQQEQMAEQLDRSLELMRRAAAEQQMNNLAQEARELATKQQALAESMAEQKPTAEQAKAQQELAEQTKELTEELARMQERLQQQGEQQTAESTQEARRNTSQAGEQMEQAARDASRQDGEQAAELGEQAAEQLEQAAETLDQARQAMADAWKQDAKQSMEQATQDALSLAERQQQLLDRMKEAEQQGSQGQQPPQMPQPGQQQSGQQQSGQQGQQGQQQGQQGQQGQQQGGQQGQQQGGQQGQQQGGQQGQQQGGQQQGGQGQQQGGQMPGQQAGSGTGAQSMQSEQSALQQGLQQLGRNLQENRERSAAMNREVGSSLGRANLSMQQTLDELQRGQLPTNQAQQTVDALNRLALSLLNNSQSLGEESGEGSQALQQMADIAKSQGELNGRSNALAPMDVTQNARGQQLNRLSAEQSEIARRLGELNRGGQESMMGDLDALAREAEEIARQMQSGRMPPETLARQERLFHRMLDAGRSLEKDEVEDERSAERPAGFDRGTVQDLDPALFLDPTRFRAPSAAELQSLPPAYRRLILDYFERLNRVQPRQPVPSGR